MARDDRDILDILKFELEFLESGGYGRSVRTPWKESSIFQDSLTCINFGDPARSRPHCECLLMDFVPEDRRSTSIPCHHIPLTEDGKTVGALEQSGPGDDLQEAVKKWLRKTIQQIEMDRARQMTY